MEIVPISGKMNKEIGLEALMLRKAELKQQIQNQKILVSTSSQKLLSPASISSYIFGAFSKSFNIIDGVLIGFKIVRSIRSFFRKR
jgi:hypothetical protein